MPAETTRQGEAPVHRIPSLDGLRALSIFLVLALHSLQRLEVSSPISFLWVGIFSGATGVLYANENPKSPCASALTQCA